MAAVAILSVTVTTALKEKLTVGSEGGKSAVDTINDTITKLLDRARK